MSSYCILPIEAFVFATCRVHCRCCYPRRHKVVWDKQSMLSLSMVHMKQTTLHPERSILFRNKVTFITISLRRRMQTRKYTLLGTNISPIKALLKMMFLFPRWDMLVPWRVVVVCCGFSISLSCVSLAKPNRRESSHGMAVIASNWYSTSQRTLGWWMTKICPILQG